MSTYVTLVLDESGSMHDAIDDTIGGYNTYVEGLQKESEEYLFTLVKFDSNKVDVVHRAIPVKDVPSLTRQTYTPGASTPLYDATMKAIKATEEKAGDAKKVIMVIQTDGKENASREYRLSDLQEKIKKKTEEGWAFLFLGANVDAFETGSRLGINVRSTMSYSKNRSQETFKTLHRATSSYGVTGQSASTWFTDEERLHSGEQDVRGRAPAPAQAPPAPKSLIDDFKI